MLRHCRESYHLYPRGCVLASILSTRSNSKVSKPGRSGALNCMIKPGEMQTWATCPGPPCSASPALAVAAELRRDLPDDTVAIGSAVVGGAVEIAVRVKCHVADRLPPVVAASKVVQRGVCPTAA